MSGIAGHENIASSQFTGLGSKGIIPALIYAFIQTALAEEIFCRGFLGKRISSKFGFIAGNIIQAFLFGLLHGVMYFSPHGVFKAFAIILVIGAIGWAMG